MRIAEAARAARKSARRRSILDVATKEFAARGYEGARVDVIAAQVGISVGAVYLYFPSKFDLFAAAVADGVDLGIDAEAAQRFLFGAAGKAATP